MITDHGKANDELASIAKAHDIEVPDTTSLVKQAKEKILDMRDESFDAAYANNQVKAHEETIELFKKQANTVTDDKVKGAPELKAFAQKMLPGLEKHLAAAKSCRPSILASNGTGTKRPHPKDAASSFTPHLNPHPYQYPHPSPPRFRPIRLRFKPRAELVVVVRMLVLLIHRRIGTLRLPVITLLLGWRRLSRHLRIDRRIVTVDRFGGLILLLLRLLAHSHLVRQSSATETSRALKIRSLPRANVQNIALPRPGD